MSDFIVYTDGSLRPGGHAAYAYVVVQDNKVIHTASGKLPNATINQAELIAIRESLKYFDKPSKLTVYSDSQYAVFSLTKWLKGWIRNEWITSTGGVVKNQDLLQDIIKAKKGHTVTFEWIRGHADDLYNELADQLAQAETSQMAKQAQTPPSQLVKL